MIQVNDRPSGRSSGSLASAALFFGPQTLGLGGLESLPFAHSGEMAAPAEPSGAIGEIYQAALCDQELFACYPT